jgi:hypothetical protein
VILILVLLLLALLTGYLRGQYFVLSLWFDLVGIKCSSGDLEIPRYEFISYMDYGVPYLGCTIQYRPQLILLILNWAGGRAAVMPGKEYPLSKKFSRINARPVIDHSNNG